LLVNWPKIVPQKRQTLSSLSGANNFACRLFTILLARKLSTVCSQSKSASRQSYHRLQFGGHLVPFSRINRLQIQCNIIIVTASTKYRFKNSKRSPVLTMAHAFAWLTAQCLPEMTSSHVERLFFNGEKTVPSLETLLLSASTTPLFSKSTYSCRRPPRSVTCRFFSDWLRGRPREKSANGVFGSGEIALIPNLYGTAVQPSAKIRIV
jgi:hypothetical protein